MLYSQLPQELREECALTDNDFASYHRYLRFNDRLGRGAFKTVWRGIDTEEMREIAWNAVSVHGIPPKEKGRIVGEIKLLHTLKHAHLIQFFGSWYDKVSNIHRICPFRVLTSAHQHFFEAEATHC